MMTIVYDFLVDDYVYFNVIKRRNISLKYVKFVKSLNITNLVSFINSMFFINSTFRTISTFSISSISSINFINSISSTSSINFINSISSTSFILSINSILSVFSVFFTFFTFFIRSFLKKLYFLKRYNKKMNDLDNYVKQNNFYTTSRYYYRRNWFSLFFFLINVIVINVYILYKLVNKDRKNRNDKRIKILSYIEFQEEITKNLFYGSGIILRQRRLRLFQKNCTLYTKSVRKDSYKEHSWVKLNNYRRCQICNPITKIDKSSNPLSERSINVPNRTERSHKDIRRSIWSYGKCNISICYNSRCWDRHLSLW